MNIGTLAVNITATTEKFSKGLNSAKSGLGKFVSGIGVAQAAVIGFATYGLQQIIDKAIEAGGALADMVEKTRVGAEQLSALHYAAGQLGSSASAVDNALQFMTKTLGKAAQGSDPAIKAFNALGIDFEKLIGLSPDKQFLAIVDALHRMESPAERAAAAQAVFGKGAKEMTPLVNAGADAILAMGIRAAETGNIITDEMVVALDEADDALKSLMGSWDTAKMTFVSDFGPVIVWVTDVVQKFLLRARGAGLFMKHELTSVLYSAVFAVKALGDAWNAVMPSILDVDTRGLGATMDDLMKARESAGAGLEKMGGDSPVDNPLARSAFNVSGHATTGAEEKAASKVEKQAAKQAARDKKEEEKKIAAATKRAADGIDQLLMQGSKRGPVLQVVGVR